MDVNDTALILDKRGAFETIASRLAPTKVLRCYPIFRQELF